MSKQSEALKALENSNEINGKLLDLFNINNVRIPAALLDLINDNQIAIKAVRKAALSDGGSEVENDKTN